MKVMPCLVVMQRERETPFHISTTFPQVSCWTSCCTPWPPYCTCWCLIQPRNRHLQMLPKDTHQQTTAYFYIILYYANNPTGWLHYTTRDIHTAQAVLAWRVAFLHNSSGGVTTLIIPICIKFINYERRSRWAK